MPTNKGTTPRKRAPRKPPVATRTVNGAIVSDADARAALTACASLQAMADYLGVSGKSAFRPFVRAKIGHVSREGGVSLVKTDERIALILDKFAPLTSA